MEGIKRGMVVIANFNPVKGSEQGGIRPAIIIQNDFGNKYSPTTIIAPVTSRKYNKEFSTNVKISKIDSKLNEDSTILLNQITTIDKSRITRKISLLDNNIMDKVDMAIKVSLNLD